MPIPRMYLKCCHKDLIRPPFQFITEAHGVTPSADKAKRQQQIAICILASCGIGLISNFSNSYMLACVSGAWFILKISDLGVLCPDILQAYKTTVCIYYQDRKSFSLRTICFVVLNASTKGRKLQLLAHITTFSFWLFFALLPTVVYDPPCADSIACIAGLYRNKTPDSVLRKRKRVVIKRKLRTVTQPKHVYATLRWSFPNPQETRNSRQTSALVLFHSGRNK
jgi:hypothetical protein